MPRTLALCLILSLNATSALGQVHVDVHLEKSQYLAGEPIVVLVDVRNIGEDPVGYSTCDGDVRLEVARTDRRVPPNIFGCFGGMLGGGACGIDHPPLLHPGQTTTFGYLLKEYDLRPGQYQLTASGKAGVRWYYPTYLAKLPPPPPPKHKQTDPVPGAQFARTLSVNVVRSTERELRAALAPLVSDADGPDVVQRSDARAALIESAPPFLDFLIARFATDDQAGMSAIEALGRMRSRTSRAHLKQIFRSSRDARRSAVVLALARGGHRDNGEFFSQVLQDGTIDRTSRQYAALGLGRIGGARSVKYLARALVSAAPELRPSIATALGNTRSRAAVPIVIGMFGNNPAQNNVCGALTTLTHQMWCGGTADDPAAQRRKWLRRWKQTGSRTPIFGPNDCAREVVPPASAPAPPAVVVERYATSSPPRGGDSRR